MLRLHVENMYHNLPAIGGSGTRHETAWWETNSVWYSHAVVHWMMGSDMMRLHGKRSKCSITHQLLVIGWVRHVEIEKYGVTHILLVMGWDIMRLPDTRKVPLTSCLSLNRTWLMRLPDKAEILSHLPPVHGIRCHETAWQKHNQVPLTSCGSRVCET